MKCDENRSTVVPVLWDIMQTDLRKLRISVRREDKPTRCH